MKKMKDGKLPRDQNRGGDLLRAHRPESNPDRQAGRDAETDWNRRRAKRSKSLLGTRVFLELFVKVQEEWRSSRGFVEELDWRRQLEADRREAAEREVAIILCYQIARDSGVNGISCRFGSITHHARAPTSARTAAVTNDIFHPKCAAINGVSEAVQAPPI